MSAGPSASIGAITNSGQIVGNVEIDNQPSVTIYGGTARLRQLDRRDNHSRL